MEPPELYSGFYTDSKPNGGAAGDHFIVEDLLDFSNDDAAANDSANGLGAIGFDSSVAGNNSTDSSTVTVVDSCNSSSFSGSDPCFPSDHNFPSIDPHLGGDLCVPYDDLAELEWLSNFVEESFSSEDFQRLQLISGGVKATRPEQSSDNRIITTTANNNSNDTNSSNNPIFNHEMAVPAKARSKRSRAAPCDWASRLLVLSPSSTTTTTSSDAEVVVPLGQHPNCGKKTVKVTVPKKRDGGEGGGAGNSDGRKCLHCATDKTPQWRTGPMGPKTLCNACGVRYKSGRLVPEYRPAASPTFVLTKHSNSHRKVLEIRRQKDLLRAQQQHQHQFLQHHPNHHHHHHHHHQSMVFDHVSNGEDYLIHQHVGPDFRQLI